MIQFQVQDGLSEIDQIQDSRVKRYSVSSLLNATSIDGIWTDQNWNEMIRVKYAATKDSHTFLRQSSLFKEGGRDKGN